MKPTWIIEKDIFHKEDLPHFLSLMEIPCKVIDYNFTGNYNSLATPDQCVLFRGSLNKCVQFYREAPWTPSVFCDLKQFDCQSYYPHYGSYLINKEYVMLPLCEAIRQKEWLFKIFGKHNDEVFVRPCSGFKEFTGKVIKKEEFELEAFEFGFYYDDPSIMVVITSVKQIQAEWRFVVADGRVLGGDLYKSSVGYMEEDYYYPMAESIVDGISKEEWKPERIFVVDIGLWKKNPLWTEFGLLEINAFSSSDWYDMPPHVLIKAANTIALDEYQKSLE